MRQQTAAPLPSVIIILGLGLAGLLACQPSEPWTSSNPEYALKAFLTALSMGDLDTARHFLSDATLSRLEANQRDILRTLGPREAPADPLDGLYRVWTPSAIDIDHIELLDHSDATASLAVHTVFGSAAQVTLRRAGERWTIDLAPVASTSPETVPSQTP